MKLLALLSLNLLLTVQAFAFGYDLSDKSIPTAARPALQTLFAKSSSLLPVKLKQALKKDLKVEISDLKAKNKDAMALYRRGHIYLDKTVLVEVMRGEAKATPTNRTHKTLYKEILAAVLHETAHAYDHEDVHSSQEYAQINYCKNSDDNRNNNRSDPECRAYINMNRSFSQNPYFLLIAGFEKDDESWMKHRSPDIYELTDHEEFFAVNMEYFLLDPEYACRRPTLARLYKSQFQHDPFPGVKCDAPLTYVVPNYKENENPVKKIDLSRVYQVHYFLADEGEDMSSGWGHSMFRLVICSPERKVVGPECMKDVNEHIILSYRAFVNGIQINTLKGLNGSYPSRLFFVPLSQVIDEYNKTEMRDIKSIPLNLTRTEIAQFVTRAIETHWSYDGKYYFVSNNCATESLNLLKSSVWRPGLIYASIKTPMGLEKELVNRKMANNSMFGNRLKAIEDAYLFDSYRSRYDMSYGVIQKTLRLPYKNFTEFLKLSAKDRSALYQGISRLTGKDRLKSAAALLMLETAAHRFVIANIHTTLQKWVLEDMKAAKKNNKKSDVVEVTESILKISNMFSQPAAFLAGAPGYGLPSGSDWEILENRTRQSQSQGGMVYSQAEAQMLQLISPEQQRELDQIKKNTEFGLSFIKAI
ncbi:DUF4105 domain-containing protein [Bdellovibrio sp. HCB-162]|uniref:DUF7844 domain-containing protein n=1 Tax=Bdellovibrio sp. HCB-162 TaxID=3394234 RepID=UPI0039BC6AB3